MAGASSLAGNQCASSSSSLIPRRLSTPAGSMATPVSAATAANDARIAARESTSVMSRSNPTTGTLLPRNHRYRLRPRGEQPGYQQDDRKREQHDHRGVPAPGGR